MTVYSLTPDVDSFWQLSPLEDQAERTYQQLSFNGNRKSDDWAIVELQWLKIDTHERPDIAYVDTGVVAINQASYDILKTTIAELVEFLPVTVESERWFVLNVLNTQDALDREKSELKLRTNGTVRITKAVLDGSKISDGRLFRCLNLPSHILSDDSPESLKSQLEKHNLKGAVFTRFE